MRYKDFHHSKKVETPLGSKLECIFCHKTGVRLYLSEDGKGICRECVKLGALSFRDYDIVSKSLITSKIGKVLDKCAQKYSLGL